MLITKLTEKLKLRTFLAKYKKIKPLENKTIICCIHTRDNGNITIMVTMVTEVLFPILALWIIKPVVRYLQQWYMYTHNLRQQEPHGPLFTRKWRFLYVRHPTWPNGPEYHSNFTVSWRSFYVLSGIWCEFVPYVTDAVRTSMLLAGPVGLLGTAPL